jgi:hypothetical protein
MFSKNQCSEFFLDLSEEQQESVAGGKVYENNKQYYFKTATSDGGNTDTNSQSGTKDKSIVTEPMDWLSSLGMMDRLMFPPKMIF